MLPFEMRLDDDDVGGREEPVGGVQRHSERVPPHPAIVSRALAAAPHAAKCMIFKEAIWREGRLEVRPRPLRPQPVLLAGRLVRRWQGRRPLNRSRRLEVRTTRGSRSSRSRASVVGVRVQERRAERGRELRIATDALGRGQLTQIVAVAAG